MSQPVPTSTDPVPSYVNQYHSILTQCHHCQQVPTYTDPVPSCINQYHLILTQYHQAPTSIADRQPLPWTAKNWECCLGITDFCTVYPGSSFVILWILSDEKQPMPDLSKLKWKCTIGVKSNILNYFPFKSQGILTRRKIQLLGLFDVCALWVGFLLLNKGDFWSKYWIPILSTKQQIAVYTSLDDTG